MHWSTRWFGKPTRPSAPTPRDPRARLGVERLEAREVPTVTYHGGAILPHPEVQAVFYGSAWAANATDAAQAATLNAYENYIVQSPYVDALTRVGYGVGRGTATAGVVDNTALADGTTVSDRTLRAKIQTDITRGLLAAPDANRLYVLYVQPNVIISMGGGNSVNSFLGYHGAFAGRDAAGHAVDIRYAVIAYPGGTVHNAGMGTSALDQLTSVASHEMAEAFTDPDVNYKSLGWYDDNLGEIGDITQSSTTRLNGYLVQLNSDRNDRPMPLIDASTLVTTSSVLAGTATRNGGTLTVVVTPSAGTALPTGFVTLLDGNGLVVKAPLQLVNGVLTATFTLSSLSRGTHKFSAVYWGDTSFLGSFTGTLTVTV